MKIAHVYWTNNGNWGDEIVGIVTKKLCSELLDARASFIDFCIESNTLSEDEQVLNSTIDAINECDLLFIGGGGCGLAIGLMYQRGFYDKIKIPIVIYGIGLNSFNVDRKPLAYPYGAKSLKYLKDRCLIFKTRNDGTAQELLACTNELVEECPPIVLSVSRYIKPKPFHAPHLLLGLAGDQGAHRYQENNVNVDVFSSKIKSFCQRYNKKIILACHRVQDGELVDGEQLWDKEIGLTYYSDCDFVIAMRGHGQIIATSYDKPVIAIVNQTKTVGYMKSFSLEELCVDVADPELDAELLSKVHYVYSNYTDIYHKIKTKRLEMWQQTVDDFKLIKNKLNV